MSFMSDSRKWQDSEWMLWQGDIRVESPGGNVIWIPGSQCKYWSGIPTQIESRGWPVSPQSSPGPATKWTISTVSWACVTLTLCWTSWDPSPRQPAQGNSSVAVCSWTRERGPCRLLQRCPHRRDGSELQGYKHRAETVVGHISADWDQQGDTSHITPEPSICGQQQLSEITEKTDLRTADRLKASVSMYCW